MFHTTQVFLDRVEAHERAGQWDEAIELCEQLFRDSNTSRNLAGLLEALLRLGLIYSIQAEHVLARDYYELALEISRRTRDGSRAARALNGLGVQSQRSGNLDTAESYYLEARTIAAADGDPRTRGDIDVNLGIVANIRGELQTALAHYQAALEHYQLVGQPQRVAMLMNNLGMLYTELGDHGSASETLDQAVSIAREIGNLQVEGIVLANRTELLLAMGDLEGARTSCDDAFEVASKLHNTEVKADLLKSYGVIFRGDGKPHLAESHFRQAITLAAEIGVPLIEADANRELALVLRSEDRNREALAALNRAHALYAALQAKHAQEDIDKRFEQLESDFLALVAQWGESIEAKDRYTSGHCQRVAEYACRLATMAGITGRDLTWFRMGAFLHDVGKTEVPEAILNKPGRLTPEERTIMERHTVVGDEMLSTIEFPWDIRPMVRSHHERWDGGGYPDQLAGGDIPYYARILHIADVFDALTTTRSYRQPLSPDAAFEIMVSDEGSFDPELFELFRELLPTFIGLIPVVEAPQT